MHIICLTPLEEGVYNDHASDNITVPPEGWAYIPEDFHLPSTFPRLGSLEAEEKPYTRRVKVQMEGTDAEGNARMEELTEEQEYTMMTVTAMTEGTLPEPSPDPGTPDTPGGSPSVWDELDAAYQEGVDSV